MEKAFKFLKNNAIQTCSEDHIHFEKDLKKLMDLGLVFKQRGWYKINPLIETKKSVTEARNSLKKKIDGWVSTMERIDNAQLDFRADMVHFFKENPMEGNVMPVNTPEEYRNTKGYCYMLEGDIVSLHAGYKPPHNVPEGCDRFKYTALLGYVEVEYF